MLHPVTQFCSHFLEIVFNTFVIWTVILEIITKCCFKNNFCVFVFSKSVVIVFSWVFSNFYIWRIEQEKAMSQPQLGVLCPVDWSYSETGTGICQSLQQTQLHGKNTTQISDMLIHSRHTQTFKLLWASRGLTS